jgi:hypothetical protein
MPFGVAKALSELMSLMIDCQQRQNDDDYCIVCFDDILINSKDDKEYSCHVTAVSETICMTGFWMEETNCTF